MKRKLILVAIGCLVLMSCNNLKDKRRLSEAKELSGVYPDSALKLLDESFNPDLMSAENLTDWWLTGAILRDSLKENMDMDTVVFPKVICYYSKKKQEAPQAQSWYYYGRTLSYYKDHVDAIPAYKNAIEYGEKAEEYNLAGYASSYLGDIYFEEYEPVQARAHYEKAAEYFDKAGNLKSMGFAYRDMALTYYKNKELDKSLELLNIADSLNSYVNDPLLKSSLMNFYTAIFRMKGKYEAVEKYFNEYIKSSSGKIEDYNIIISSYLDQKKFDEARYYLDSLNNIAKDEEKAFLLRRYYLLEKEVGNSAKALDYYEKYITIRNNAWEEDYSKELIKIERKYDRQRLINQNNQMKIKQQQQTLIIIAFALILAILIAITWIRNIKKKNRELNLLNKLVSKEKELADKKNIELKLTNKVVLQEKELAEKENEILRMKAKEDQVCHMRDFLLEKSQLYTKLQIITDIPRGCKNKQKEFEERVKEIYQNPVISEKDWMEMRELMEELSPNFVEKLNAANIKNKSEINFCCLIRFGLPSDKMIILLNLTKESLKSKKYRVVRKLGIANTDVKLKAYLDDL